MTPDHKPVTDPLGTLRAEFREHVAENTRSHDKLMVEVHANVMESKRHREEEEKMRLAIFGNGKRGLAEDVRNLKDIMASVKKLGLALLTTAVISMSALLWMVVQDYIQRQGPA